MSLLSEWFLVVAWTGGGDFVEGVETGLANYRTV